MLDKTPISSQLLELASAAAPGLGAVAGDRTTADLREAGLSSVAAVRLMLEIEAAFDLAIPDGDLTPENFANVASIERLIRRLKGQAPA
jgi:acyl carrier protein